MQATQIAHTFQSQTAIVRTDGEPQQFPCWIVGGEFFYSADEAGIAAQAAANSVGDTIRVYLQRDRKSSRETWQRVEPEKVIRLIPLAPVPRKPAIASKPKPREPHPEDKLSNRELILHRADIMVANRQLLLVGLLQLHPHCSGCGMELVARPNEANTAVLAGTRLSCKGCSAKLKEETLSEIHQEIRVRNLTSKKKRVCGKRIRPIWSVTGCHAMPTGRSSVMLPSRPSSHGSKHQENIRRLVDLLARPFDLTTSNRPAG